MDGAPAQCELCNRHPIEVTRHHLIPRARHSKGLTKRNFDRAEMTARIAMLCRSCHKFIHSVLSERQLAEHYNTLEDLRHHPEIQKFVTWIRAKPAGLRVPSRRKQHT